MFGDDWTVAPDDWKFEESDHLHTRKRTNVSEKGAISKGKDRLPTTIFRGHVSFQGSLSDLYNVSNKLSQEGQWNKGWFGKAFPFEIQDLLGRFYFVRS